MQLKDDVECQTTTLFPVWIQLEIFDVPLFSLVPVMSLLCLTKTLNILQTFKKVKHAQYNCSFLNFQK